MEYTFKRASLLPAIFLACGLIMMCSSLIVVVIGSFTGVINFMMSILFIGQAVWNFSTPIIKISHGVLYHKKGILANEDMELKNIEKVDFPKPSRVDLVFYNGHIEKIYLKNMVPESREEFRQIIVELIEQNRLTK